jgi:hypothetical protein
VFFRNVAFNDLHRERSLRSDRHNSCHHRHSLLEASTPTSQQRAKDHHEHDSDILEKSRLTNSCRNQTFTHRRRRWHASHHLELGTHHQSQPQVPLADAQIQGRCPELPIRFPKGNNAGSPPSTVPRSRVSPGGSYRRLELHLDNAFKKGTTP